MSSYQNRCLFALALALACRLVAARPSTPGLVVRVPCGAATAALVRERGYALPRYDLQAKAGEAEKAAYAGMLTALQAAKVTFVVGGNHALQTYTGLGRPTSEIEVYLPRHDLSRAAVALKRAGFSVLNDENGNSVASRGDYRLVLITHSANRLEEVDPAWFGRGAPGKLFDVPVRYASVEELIRAKSFVMERNRFEGHDVGYLLHQQGRRIDWDRLVSSFGNDWEVLFLQLQLFRYSYPARATIVPDKVWRDLAARARAKYANGASDRDPTSGGPRLSQRQFAGVMDEWGYVDSRPVRPGLPPPMGTYAKMGFDTAGSLDQPAREAYAGTLRVLNAANIDYLVSGTFAMGPYTGLGRETKDFDVFIKKDDLAKAMAALGEVDFLVSSQRFDKPRTRCVLLGKQQLVAVHSSRYPARMDIFLDTRAEDTTTSEFLAQQKNAPPVVRRCFLHDEEGILLGVARGLGRAVVLRKVIPKGLNVEIARDLKPVKAPLYLLYRDHSYESKLLARARELLLKNCPEEME